MSIWRRCKRAWRRFKKRLTTDVDRQVEDIVQSRTELLQVFDGLDDPVAVIDRQFIVQRVNKAMLAAAGKKSFEECIGKHCWEALHGLKERCPQCTAPLTFTSGKKTSRVGFIMGAKNPLETTYHVTCYPLTDKNGEVHCLAEYYRDVTEVTRLNRQIYESERARVMEPLTAGLAHQIRQPLTIIRSAAQYGLDALEKGMNNHDFEETMTSIIENVDSVNDVLINLLHFSKPTSSQMRKGTLPMVLEQGLKLVGHQLKEKKIAVRKNWESRLPELMMDDKRLLQAVLNLLMNAIESMPSGGHLTLQAAYQKQTMPPNILLTIQDTGKGIPRELVSKLGHPFFSTKEGGVGLGLSIADGIIRSHGGRMEFESRENEGTKVLIELPVPGG